MFKFYKKNWFNIRPGIQSDLNLTNVRTGDPIGYLICNEYQNMQFCCFRICKIKAHRLFKHFTKPNIHQQEANKPDKFPTHVKLRSSKVFRQHHTKETTPAKSIKHDCHEFFSIWKQNTNYTYTHTNRNRNSSFQIFTPSSHVEPKRRRLGAATFIAIRSFALKHVFWSDRGRWWCRLVGLVVGERACAPPRVVWTNEKRALPQEEHRNRNTHRRVQSAGGVWSPCGSGGCRENGSKREVSFNIESTPHQKIILNKKRAKNGGGEAQVKNHLNNKVRVEFHEFRNCCFL